MKTDFTPDLFGVECEAAPKKKARVSRLDKSIKKLCAIIESHTLSQKVESLNAVKLALHKISPFQREPVNCVLWVQAKEVGANDYNPNSVAPPEMKLLEQSILEDGYTQPIVGWKTPEKIEVVDGFHRNRVGKESPVVSERIQGYLPVVLINSERQDLSDRMASTIRHNRARGKHKVEAMSDIVIELKRRNWSDEKICKNLGMDQDEILRLVQITGLTEMFSDQEFSKAWDVEGHITEADFAELTDDVETFEEEIGKVRTVNTSDENRVFHTYEKWECYAAGFYATTKDGMTKAQCEQLYKDFLASSERFEVGLQKVTSEWKHSCEHYLTNGAMNRIAWLGQAAVCAIHGIPSAFRSGFSLLSEPKQETANQLALTYLNRWLEANGRPAVTMEEAYSGDRQSDIY